MAGFNRYTGNRLEILAERLAECLRKPLPSALQPDIILVQSAGMQRWLSMELALHHGICANVHFPFPNAFLDDLFHKLLPAHENAPPYDPEVLAWQIMRVLPSCLASPKFADLHRYLKDDASGIKRYQFCCRLADLFDQYLIFRPDMILAWEAERDGHDEGSWQAELWRKLRRDDPCHHPARIRQLLLERLRTEPPASGLLPERMAVFGISWLPLFHLEILHELSGYVDVHFFALNPCREFWTHIRSRREMDRSLEKIRESTGKRDLSEEDLHLESGNSLLSSTGAQGRDFFRWLGDLPAEEHEFFAEADGDTLLTALQSDILNLRERGTDGQAKTPIDPLDRSLRIHSCHSPVREVEVLHDELLALFDDDPGLEPHDILVMAPDMDVYTPLIEAVFDARRGHRSGQGVLPRIPFAIADRNLKNNSPVMDHFLELLDLADGRFEASSILSLLEKPPVREKFGLTAEEMERIRKWITDAGVRWGIDGEARRRTGLPGFSENSWRAGLERLLMGYALPGNAERLFGGILPCDNIEGMETQALGRLLEYLYGLFAMTKLLEQPGKPREWTNALSSLLDQFFKCKETAQGDLQALRQIIQRLSSLSERSGFDAPLHIDIIKAFLHRHAEQRTAGAGFMSGGVTCCEMLPMRSIPFKVICLLGLNHDAYPRPARKLGFDLMARHPRAGDRSRRRDDRYLFLEALLSARQALIISYCGQSIADNAPLPPSVLVSELLDVIEQGFRTQEGTATARLTTHHRLQAFHSTYFCTESSRLSYSEENLHAAIRLQERRDQPHFIQDPLPGPGQEWKTVDIGELVRFYQNPSRFWIEKRLLTTIPESGDMPADTEAFDLRGLDRYGLEQDLLAGVLAGRRLEELFAVYRAAGRLPHGNVGAGHCKALTRDIETFAARIRPYFQEKPSEFFDVCLDISGFRLTGHIEPYGPDGLFQYRFTDLKAKDHLRMWIQHLVLLSAARQPVTSKLAGRDEMWIYAPAQDVEVLLEGLLSIYWNGLSMPIHFFPDSSFEFASQALLKGKPVADAIRSARRIWYGSEYNRGESEDRYYRRCFENREALDEEFQRLSLIVCEPIFKFRKHL